RRWCAGSRGACLELLRLAAGDRRSCCGGLCPDRRLCRMSHAYRLATLKLASAIEMSGLTPWEGASENRADPVFRLGAVPPSLEMADHVDPPFQVRSGGGPCLLDLPDTGRFLIERGSEITVEPQ